MSGSELLTVAEMGEADRLAVESGVPSLTLMENAGHAVADCIEQYYPEGRVIVLCGPGNNGGDGVVAARLLRDQGRDVRLGLLCDPSVLKGDAAEMAKRWSGEVNSLSEALNGIDRNCVVVDALFGAGLTRPLEGEALKAVLEVGARRVPIVAVDVPSGTHGDTGRVLGEMPGSGAKGFRAEHTVTFFRKKVGHVLFPGRVHCGQIHLADIGIPEMAIDTPGPSVIENGPREWLIDYPWPRADAHKYDRGHALIVSGHAHATGAARLAARGALRIGAGLVSVASPPDAVATNAAHLTAIMIKPFGGPVGLAELLEDKRFTAVVLGPGLGVGEWTRELVEAVLASHRPAVLDADALTAFEEEPETLFGMLHGSAVLTPHAGEFERLFPGLLARSASKLEAARSAAARTGCVVLLKGPDTVIANQGGWAAINTNAPPWLATAGAGDVLAGMIGGLLAQAEVSPEFYPFDAACAAAWLHGAAAAKFGIGLIAEDLPEILPEVLRELQESVPGNLMI